MTVYKTTTSSLLLLFLLVLLSPVAAVAREQGRRQQQQQHPLVAYSADDLDGNEENMPHLQMSALAGTTTTTTMTMTAAALLLSSFLSSPVLAASTGDLNWYPPSSSQINNLTAALDPRSGTYGFIYNTSTPAYSGAVPYGTYNWCNMPHVRRAEYVVPGAGDHTAGEWALKYVEVVSLVALSLSPYLISLSIPPSCFYYNTCPCLHHLSESHAKLDLML